MAITINLSAYFGSISNRTNIPSQRGEGRKCNVPEILCEFHTLDLRDNCSGSATFRKYTSKVLEQRLFRGRILSSCVILVTVDAQGDSIL